jgi:hypothetical protein
MSPNVGGTNIDEVSPSFTGHCAGTAARALPASNGISASGANGKNVCFIYFLLYTAAGTSEALAVGASSKLPNLCERGAGEATVELGRTSAHRARKIAIDRLVPRFASRRYLQRAGLAAEDFLGGQPLRVIGTGKSGTT